MPFALLDGTSATVDITFGTNSVKCMFGYWSATFDRQTFGATTFCSGGWVETRPGMRQLRGRADGFASKGAPYTDPSLYITNTTASNIILQADASCTITFNGWVTSDTMGMRAAGMSERSVAFESTGAVTTAWTTS